MIIRHITNMLLSIPLLPILYYQGKQIKKSIPKLPEATGSSGFVHHNSDKQLKLLCLGESTMAGVGVATHDEGFAGTLAKALVPLITASVKWEVIARSGYTAEHVAQKLVPKIDFAPDIIVIALGGNDAFTLSSPKKWKNSIQELIDRIQDKFPNVPIAFTNMPPIKAFPAFTWPIRFVIGNLVEILGQALEEVVEENSDVYYSSERIDLKIWSERYGVKNETSAFFSDGVHPSLLTYQVWAKDFAGFLSPIINKN